eukprot:m.50664 g.50664  ORF g.50664 m.50664 type:complete len:250 (+) comp7524_c0_seq2:36-785(+)
MLLCVIMLLFQECNLQRAGLIISHLSLIGFAFLAAPVTIVMEEENEKKVLVIGHSEAGKTSFVVRYTEDKFEGTYKVTLGVDFHLKVVDRGANMEPMDLQLWDIGGQDKESQLLRVYFKHAVGCVIVFDLTNRTSFDRVADWKKELDSKVSAKDAPCIPTILLGNKCDLPNQVVSDSEIEAYLAKNKGKYIGFKKVSAKENTNVDAAMKLLIEAIEDVEPYVDPSIGNNVVIKKKSIGGGDDPSSGCCS